MALVLAASSIHLGFGLFSPYLPLYAQLLGAISVQIGFLTSAFMATRCVMATPFGYLSDRIGRKRMIVAGLFAYSVISASYGLATHWTHLTLIRAFQGIASASVWPVILAFIADLIPPEDRAFAMGLYNSVGMGAWVIGPAVGGAIQQYSRRYLGVSLTESYHIPFYVCGALGLASALLVLLLVEEDGKRSPQSKPLTSPLHF